jgi:nitrate reductase (cytochrome), electron transfer subunit
VGLWRDLVTASASGYFMGLRQTGSQLNDARDFTRGAGRRARAAIWKPNGAAGHAIREQDRLRDGPNAAWENHLNKLVQPVVDYGALTNVTEAERALALRERASRRAFDGAPPVVPHPVAQDSAAACLACHGPGLVIKDKVASKMSHALYTSCTQCHVPAVGPRIPMPDMTLLEPLTENQFVGLRIVEGQPRLAAGAADDSAQHVDAHRLPELPRTAGFVRPAHASSRPAVVLQCHAPGAHLDQYQFLSAEPKR